MRIYTHTYVQDRDEWKARKREKKINDFLLPDKSCIENRIPPSKWSNKKNLPEKSSGWCLQEAKTSDTIECNPIHFDSNNSNNDCNNMNIPRQINAHCAIDCMDCVLYTAHTKFILHRKYEKSMTFEQKSCNATNRIQILFVLGAIGWNKRHLTFLSQMIFSIFHHAPQTQTTTTKRRKINWNYSWNCFYVDIFTLNIFIYLKKETVELQMNFTDFLPFFHISGWFSMPTDGWKWLHWIENVFKLIMEKRTF